jgi:catechol 2,3-dioxygenase-like lactoylglutathione lyase family enzyme
MASSALDLPLPGIPQQGDEIMIQSLNHFSIRTVELEASRQFYEEVLGLKVGPRPDFPFPGLWIYAGDTGNPYNAVVHIIGIDRNDPEGLKKYLGERDEGTLQGGGALDHVAFFATGLADMLAHLKGRGIAPRERTVPSIGLHQLFLDDPNGIVIELNYPAAEKVRLDA